MVPTVYSTSMDELVRLATPRVRQVRAVFFDLAGTLIHVRGGLGHQYALIAKEFGVIVDPKAIDDVFGQALRAAGPMREDERGFWKSLVRDAHARAGTAMDDPTFDRYFERLFEHFAGADAWEVYPDVVPALDQLVRNGLILGLVTNFDRRVIRLLPAVGLDSYFSSLAIPAYAGVSKPERAIFDYALSRHGLQPDEAMQVGDSPEEDVGGAEAAGLRAVLLDRRGRYAGADPAPIRSLDELPERLGLR